MRRWVPSGERDSGGPVRVVVEERQRGARLRRLVPESSCRARRTIRFEFNEGGYQTLNFVPAIGTILLGVFCGQLLMSDRRWWQKFLFLVLGGGVCLGLGVVAGEYACPIVKRIWTPSWVLFSGAWVIWGLAIFYLVFDLCRLRWIGVAVGRGRHEFAGLLSHGHADLVRGPRRPCRPTLASCGAAVSTPSGWPTTCSVGWSAPISAVLLFWLIALWMYCKKYFVRV